MGGDSGNPDFEGVFNAALFREHLFTVKSKLETVRDEQRLKTTVVKLRPLEGFEAYCKEASAMAAAVRRYVAGK